jgi:hypothetical protein
LNKAGEILRTRTVRINWAVVQSQKGGRRFNW